MRQAMEYAMPADDEQNGELRLPNTLSFTPDHTTLIVGHLLRKLYTDMLEAEFPERLQPLIEELAAQQQANKKWKGQ
jgi:hypothetical protein